MGKVTIVNNVITIIAIFIPFSISHHFLKANLFFQYTSIFENHRARYRYNRDGFFLFYLFHFPYKPLFLILTKTLSAMNPPKQPLIEAINNHILTGEMYKALKDSKKLIAYEGELLAHAKRGPRLR